MHARHLLPVAAAAALGLSLAGSVAAQSQPSDSAANAGFRIESTTLVQRCSSCHRVDDDGRMTRISYLRKTPEGWQTSIRRMVALHGVGVSQDEAREIVRYLSNEQGLAPDELRPALFEVERRIIDHDWDGDSGVEFTCIQCHSMGRVMTQRRTEEEWGLLLATHRALYPLVDFQAFRRNGPPPEQGERRHPMDVAIDVLSETYPLETPEWSAWAATKRPPRLAGTWALSGQEPGRGALHGTVTIAADPSDPDAFTTSIDYVYDESGVRVRRTGEAMVYTGYQWRGRSNPAADDELREVMFVERDQQSMTGRWFHGDYDELGPDVTLRRVGGTVLTGVFPRAVRRGSTVELRVFGGGLGSGATANADFGAGITVESTSGPTAGAFTVRVRVDTDAATGGRDLFAFGSVLEDALVVHDGVDRVEVTPRTGMARVGGANFPKGYQVFDAHGFDDGPDGEPNTADDLDLGRVNVQWRLEEYAAVYDDEDLRFVGTLGQDGVFVPAEDGPNPNRAGNRNNTGDVWVVATYTPPDGEPLSGRAHLVVTLPLYIRFDPWRSLDDPRTAAGSP